MDSQKIIIVATFLVSLLLLQHILKKVLKKSTAVTNSPDDIKLQSRLKLSSDERIDVVSIHGRSYFIILSKGAQPTVQAIEPEIAFANPELNS